MAAATGLRKSSSSINDYPEHLNPFHEEDNHNRIRFWTIGRNKPSRSSSFSLNNIKDFRNTWSLKSFMKKNKKGHESEKATKATTTPSPVNGEASPVVYRRAIQYSSSPESTPASSRGGERYEYRGSVTPLPRSRFQERLRSTPPPPLPGHNNFTHNAPGRASFSHRAGEPYALPGLARSEIGGSRVSVESANPFEEDGTSPNPVPARRRKKRAAPLPPGHNVSITTSATADQLSSVPAGEDGVKKKGDKDIGLDDPSLQIQLKIVEDVEDTPPTEDTVQPSNTNELGKEITKVKIQEDTEIEVSSSVTMEVATDTINNNSTKKETMNTDKASIEIRNKKQDSIDSDNNDVVFEKINIREYRRNSSFNSDSINLRNDNTEVSPLNNKRCKSLSNTINANNNFTSYDITLHIDEDNNEVKDVNDNTPGPQKVVCKLFDGGRRSSRRKASADNSISSTEKEFIEIDRATRELEQEVNKLNSSVKYKDDHPRKSNGMSVSEMKSRFENPAMYSPNPIPKPRRSRAGSTSPVSPRAE